MKRRRGATCLGCSLQSAAGVAPCRMALLLLLPGLLALAVAAAGQSACPVSVNAPTSFRFSVAVSNDTALLAAMGDPQVDGILMDRDIVLGELSAWGAQRGVHLVA